MHWMPGTAARRDGVPHFHLCLPKDIGTSAARPFAWLKVGSGKKLTCTKMLMCHPDNRENIVFADKQKRPTRRAVDMRSYQMRRN